MDSCTKGHAAKAAWELCVRLCRDRVVLMCVAMMASAALLAGCGDPHGSASAELQLPMVGTVGRTPEGESVIQVVVDADGRISVDGEGPLSLTALESVLDRKTRDPRWREDDATSRRVLLIDADARVPWVIPAWVMCVGAQPRALLWRCFLGARARGTAAAEPATRGALACHLNGDRYFESSYELPASPRLQVLLHAEEGEAMEPERILPALRACMAESPDDPLWLELEVLHEGGQWIRTGFVVELLALAMAEGVRHVELSRLWLPSVDGKDYPGQPAFDPGDVRALLAYVAKLKASPRQPRLGIVDVPASVLQQSSRPPPARGQLDVLFGAGLLPGEVEPLPRSMEGLPGNVAGDVAEDTEEVLETDVEAKDDGGEVTEAGVLAARDAARPASSSRGLYDRPKQRRRRYDDALMKALDWLAAHQLEDGSWSSAAAPRGDLRSTGWALLAFLSAGFPDGAEHRFADVVRRGFAWLEADQRAGADNGDSSVERAMLGQAAAALASVQILRRTRRLRYHFMASRALEGTLSWHESAAARTADFDTTLHMALPVLAAWWATKEAAEQGLPEPLVPMARIETVVRGLPDRLRAPSTDVQIAARAWLLGLLEDPAHDEELGLLRASLVTRVRGWQVPASGTDPAIWWFGSLALFQAGGASWDVVKEHMHARGIESQVGGRDVDQLSGSWAPAEGSGHGFDGTQTTSLMAFTYALLFRYDAVFGSDG